MQRHRFYAPPAQIKQTQLTLDAEETHHLARVLRLSTGARVYAFDGCGQEYECEVAQVGRHEAVLTIIKPLADEVESPLQLTLAQALGKGDKFDWVVQKATELGVRRIVPLITEHSEIRRAGTSAEQKLQRWRRIALEAVKQCGRRRLVEIAEPIGWDDFRICETAQIKLIFAERGGRRLSELAAGTNSVCVAVAAEGGWSDAELQSAAQASFIPIHLGARILRTETAAIVAVTLAQYRFGDLG